MRKNNNLWYNTRYIIHKKTVNIYTYFVIWHPLIKTSWENTSVHRPLNLALHILTKIFYFFGKKTISASS